MEHRPESVPNFKQGQRRVWIVAAICLVLGVAAVFALSGVFDKKPKRSSEEAEQNREGGCPCGCDRSETMAAELRTGKADDASSAIERSLATISEREAAGYITERMVLHRLRLLDLEREMVGV